MKRLVLVLILMTAMIGLATANTVTAATDVTLEGKNTNKLALDWYPIPELEILANVKLALPDAVISGDLSGLYTAKMFGFGAGVFVHSEDIIEKFTGYVQLTPIEFLLIRIDAKVTPFGDEVLASLTPYATATFGPIATTVGYDILANGTEGRFYVSAVFTW